jgi:hypothetical protein
VHEASRYHHQTSQLLRPKVKGTGSLSAVAWHRFPSSVYSSHCSATPSTCTTPRAPHSCSKHTLTPSDTRLSPYLPPPAAAATPAAVLRSAVDRPHDLLPTFDPSGAASLSRTRAYSSVQHLMRGLEVLLLSAFLFGVAHYPGSRLRQGSLQSRGRCDEKEAPKKSGIASITSQSLLQTCR